MIEFTCPCGATMRRDPGYVEQFMEIELAQQWHSRHGDHGQTCGSVMDITMQVGHDPVEPTRFARCALPVGHPGWHENADHTATWGDPAQS